MKLTIPSDVKELGKALESAGYEWFLVGGSVRDALLGEAPHDYDMATDATPVEMKKALSAFRYFETGIKHGTLTVLTRARSVEVTTYRIDGGYQDARHPQTVTFSSSIQKDLARRDFTVNALAYHPIHGLVDEYGGEEDLKRGIIRCVREPEERFREDALRILRALRFSATLGFAIEPATARAIAKRYPLLSKISAERIWSELGKILCGKDAVRVLREYKEVFFFLMPEMAGMDGCSQQNPYHIFDVWEHTLQALSHTPPDMELRFAVLWHDLGKPETFTVDENGVGHFYGHAKKSAELAQTILIRMKADNKTKRAILRLIEDHDRMFGDSEKALRRYVANTSLSHTRALFKLKRADVWGQAPHVREERLEKITQAEHLLDEWEQEADCLSIKDMALGGKDIIHLGVPEGKQVGVMLNILFSLVLSGEVPNEREALLKKAEEYIR